MKHEFPFLLTSEEDINIYEPYPSILEVEAGVGGAPLLCEAGMGGSPLLTEAGMDGGPFLYL